MNNHLAGGPGRPDLTLNWRPILTDHLGFTIAYRARVRRGWRRWRHPFVYVNDAGAGVWLAEDRRGRVSWHIGRLAAMQHCEES
jgi:hypothetical protein